MTTTMTHSNCDHPSTKAARAACRKARSFATAIREGHLADLIAVFASKGDDLRWLFRAADAFAQVRTSDRFEAAAAVLDYFAPSGDADRDAHRKANGYLVTSDPYAMLRAILRRSS